MPTQFGTAPTFDITTARRTLIGVPAPKPSQKRSYWLVPGILFGVSAGYAFFEWALHRDNPGALWTAITRALAGGYLILIWRSLKANRRFAWSLIWWGMIAGCMAYISVGIIYLIRFDQIWLKLWMVVVIAAPVALLAYYKIAPFYRAKDAFIGNPAVDRSRAPEMPVERS